MQSNGKGFRIKTLLVSNAGAVLPHTRVALGDDRRDDAEGRAARRDPTGVAGFDHRFWECELAEVPEPLNSSTDLRLQSRCRRVERTAHGFGACKILINGVEELVEA